MSKNFRFGVVAAAARSGADWIEKARRVEGLGFSTLVTPDGMQRTLSPFGAVAAAAASTTTLRVGTYVIANDLRHPAMLAKEAGTLDFLSGGRFELGIGAGRPNADADNAMLGLPFDGGGVRVRRLKEAIAILKPLLAGETVNQNGEFYQATNASTQPGPVQKPLPLLIAASQRQLLTLAGKEADIVALAIQPHESTDQVQERIGWLREAAGPRFDAIELNINLMAVAGQTPRHIQMTMGEGAAQLAESDAIPVLKGSVDAMCERLAELRERFGLSYFMVGDEMMDALASV
ncbi:MAG TPA: TIGR03621 family F420-dependent LLM class oxidoreductase, partial [Chloroflexota bacterium]|nr:TIGR03621 family F420-dependent LLM class oxidoreductase [Chloroflexota bacterium]